MVLLVLFLLFQEQFWICLLILLASGRTKTKKIKMWKVAFILPYWWMPLRINCYKQKGKCVMKFICDRKELCKAIASLSKAIAKNPFLKVLEGIRIQWDSFYSNKVSLCGYDMELGIQANVPALTEGDGDFVVSYQSNLLKLLLLVW